jgi:hypothetical protein
LICNAKNNERAFGEASATRLAEASPLSHSDVCLPGKMRFTPVSRPSSDQLSSHVAAGIIQLATLPANGATCSYFVDRGVLLW